MDKIKLKSQDGWFFTVTPGIARQSKIIREKLEARKYLNPIHEVFPINCRGRTLEKIIEWCDYHQNDPIPEETERYKCVQKKGLPNWDEQFFNVDFIMIYELYYTSYHLKIKQMAHNSQTAILRRINGKEEEEIYELFRMAKRTIKSNVAAA